MELRTEEEQIAKYYSSAVDSVNVLSKSKPDDFSDEEWAEYRANNLAYIQDMVAKDFWTDQDLAPLNAAIAANSGE